MSQAAQIDTRPAEDQDIDERKIRLKGIVKAISASKKRPFQNTTKNGRMADFEVTESYGDDRRWTIRIYDANDRCRLFCLYEHSHNDRVEAYKELEKELLNEGGRARIWKEIESRASLVYGCFYFGPITEMIKQLGKTFKNREEEIEFHKKSILDYTKAICGNHLDYDLREKKETDQRHLIYVYTRTKRELRLISSSSIVLVQAYRALHIHLSKTAIHSGLSRLFNGILKQDNTNEGITTYNTSYQYNLTETFKTFVFNQMKNLLQPQIQHLTFLETLQLGDEVTQNGGMRHFGDTVFEVFAGIQHPMNCIFRSSYADRDMLFKQLYDWIVKYQKDEGFGRQIFEEVKAVYKRYGVEWTSAEQVPPYVGAALVYVNSEALP